MKKAIKIVKNIPLPAPMQEVGPIRTAYRKMKKGDSFTTEIDKRPFCYKAAKQENIWIRTRAEKGNKVRVWHDGPRRKNSKR